MDKQSAASMINNIAREGRKSLSEFESKQVLAVYNIPISREILVRESDEITKAIREIGYPLVMKACSSEIAHKTERGLIRVDIRCEREALEAYDYIMASAEGSKVDLLVQEMIVGRRELVMGLTRDEQFGPCVMFGLGGIFTEILRDVAFRRAPLDQEDALDMMNEIRGRSIIAAARGMKEADREQLAGMLISVGQIGLEIGSIAEIDLNPVILCGSKPVVVDALIILA